MPIAPPDLRPALTLAVPRLLLPGHCALQPHVEAATIYGLRPQALLVFLPKYHLKARGGGGAGWASAEGCPEGGAAAGKRQTHAAMWPACLAAPHACRPCVASPALLVPRA